MIGAGGLEGITDDSPLKAAVIEDPAPDKEPKPEVEKPDDEPAVEAKADDPDAKKSVYERGVETFDDLAELFDLDTDKLSAHLKIKGADGELVPLKSILEAHAKAPDLAKREQEVVAYRAELEQVARNLEAEKSQRMGELETLTKSLKNELLREEATIDWAKLEEEDPIGFFRKRDDLREKREKIDLAERASLIEREKQFSIDRERGHQALLAEQNALLTAKPEWKDQKVFAEEMAGVRSYLHSKGISDVAIDGIDNHALLILAWEATQYGRLKSGKVIDAKRVREAPLLIKPDARGEEKPSSQTRTEELRRTLKRTGSEEAALELIRGMV